MTGTDEEVEQQTQENVIDRVVGSKRDEAWKLLYRLRWLGNDFAWDTLEPVEHLPRSAVHRYLRLVSTASLQTLGNAQYGKSVFEDSLVQGPSQCEPEERREKIREERSEYQTSGGEQGRDADF